MREKIMTSYEQRTVSAIAVVDLANELLQKNVVTMEQLQLLDVKLCRHLNEHKKNNEHAQLIQEQRIDERVLNKLWHLAAGSSSTPDIGLLIGKTVNRHAKGTLANWISQSRNLGEAFELFRDNIALLNPSESWMLKAVGQESVLIFRFLEESSYPHCATERSMAALLAWSEYLCGQPINVLGAEFTVERPGYIAEYERIFGSNIMFGSTRNAIRIDKCTFEQPIVEANPYLKQLISERAARILEEITPSSGLTPCIISLMRSDLPTFRQIDNVCHVLHMSRSTLYRKLKAENTTYSELLSNVRKTLAGKLIRNNATIHELLETLDFKDASTFYKAHKRWFG
jgi:AraC-like DNA-binding protein